MKTIDSRLQLLKNKIEQNEPIKVMILGLGSVGLYLLDYIISLGDSNIHIIIVGRDFEKISKEVNIVRTAAAIRGQLQSKIIIEDNVDFENIESISEVMAQNRPDFIINSSRVFSGLKYGSISWPNLRSYGIWTPLAVRYIRNIMEAYSKSESNAIVLNTSYSDAVIPWLKSAGKSFPDFGSGNLNHLIPRIKFYIADKFNIENINEIDVTLATSHFHDVVISKEGHSERQKLLLSIKYKEQELIFDQNEVFKACSISMPTDHKRNMMNASSNFDIFYSILDSIKHRKIIKIHSPGAMGEIGGYPYIVDSTEDLIRSYFDTSIFNMDNMRDANKSSIYLDGIENIENGYLIYTDELVEKVKRAFNVDLPKRVHFDDIDKIGDYLINHIITPSLS